LEHCALQDAAQQFDRTLQLQSTAVTLLNMGHLCSHGIGWIGTRHTAAILAEGPWSNTKDAYTQASSSSSSSSSSSTPHAKKKPEAKACPCNYHGSELARSPATPNDASSAFLQSACSDCSCAAAAAFNEPPRCHAVQSCLCSIPSRQGEHLLGSMSVPQLSCNKAGVSEPRTVGLQAAV
jgi:hypothetical protein